MLYRKFSENVGLLQPRDVIQKDSINDELKTAIWNVFYASYVSPLQVISAENGQGNNAKYSKYYWYFYRLYRWCVGGNIDEMSDNKHGIAQWFKEVYFGLEWNEIYDLIEFTLENPEPAKIKDIQKQFDYLLKEHLSAYRIINNRLAEITDEQQIASIENAIKDTAKSKLNGAKLHLETALRFLANRDSPDYRNSIKESISAVESVCVIISHEQENTLGKALHAIEGKINLPKTLKEGFSKLYNWTSDKNSGIRHFMLDDPNLDSEDAIYMLVSCSAFISYLIVKANKAGIDLSK